MKTYTVEFKTTYTQAATFVSSSKDPDEARQSFQDYILNTIQGFGPKLDGVEIVSFNETEPVAEVPATLN